MRTVFGHGSVHRYYALSGGMSKKVPILKMGLKLTTCVPSAATKKKSAAAESKNAAALSAPHQLPSKGKKQNMTGEAETAL